MGERDEARSLMMGGGDGCGGGDGVRELLVYICWGGYTEEGGDRMLSYCGGRKDCVWVKENMYVREVQNLVEEVMGEGLKGRKLWYNMKYDRTEVMLLLRDVDVKKLMKGNDEHGYIYVGGEKGSFGRRFHDNAAVGDKGVQQGMGGGGNGKMAVGGGHTAEGEVVCGTSGRGSGCGNREVVKVTQRGIVQEGSGSDDGGGNAVKRGRNLGEEFPEGDSSYSSSSSEDEEGVDGELWPQSGVHSQAYRRRMVIWKNEFKGKG